jgi:CRISPR-associated endonuclease/helicase Cas3
MVTHEAQTRVDVAFPLAGEAIPMDHGYALFSALSRVLGDGLHGADWLAVHPVRGIPRQDGTLALKRHALALQLRVVPAQIPAILPLAGRSLEVLGRELLVGSSRLFALRPSASLFARTVVIKGFMDEGPFREAVARQLAERGVKARVELGRRRVVNIAGDRVVGFAVALHDLNEADSLTAQNVGVGGRQRFGCGVFVPTAPAKEA